MYVNQGEFTLPESKVTSGDLTQSAKSGWLWAVVKHNGQVFLRGYLPHPMSEGAIQKGAFWLMNVGHSGVTYNVNSKSNEPSFDADNPVKVTLPLESLRFDAKDGGSSSESYEWAHVLSGATPDTHLNEPW